MFKPWYPFFFLNRIPSGLNSLFPSEAYEVLLQILCTDDRHSPRRRDWSSKANGLPMVEPEGKREKSRGGRDVVWSWVSELTGTGQGGGRKNMPPGEPQDPLFSPLRQHGLILTGLAGVPSAFMWLLVLHRATLKRCQWELLWLFELCIRLICCPSQHYSSSSVSHCSVVLSLDGELSAEHKNLCKPPSWPWIIKQKLEKNIVGWNISDGSYC